METITKHKDWEVISRKVFNIFVFLLPIFVIPFAFYSFDFSKSFILYTGVSLSFVFWLVGALQKGEIKVPKSPIFLTFGGVIIAWAISSFFSLNKALSFIGSGYEVGTFTSIVFLGLILFLASILFQSEKKVLALYFIFSISATIVFLFQVFQILGDKLNIVIPKWEIFQSPIANLVGGWNSFSIFFGFVGLISLIFFELSKPRKKHHYFFVFMLVISLLAMFISNFTSTWIIFGSFAFLFLIYLLSNIFLKSSTDISSRNFFNLTFFVLMISLFVILGRGAVSSMTTYLNTTSAEIRPSLSSTFTVTKDTLKEDPILGSGPNTFTYDWMKYKPKTVSMTSFKNVRFESGIGTIPSFAAETGLLGFITFLLFLVSVILLNGISTISYATEDESRAVLFSTFFGSLYLWIFAIIYSPGSLIFALAFLMTGLTLATLVKIKNVKVITVRLFDNARSGFLSTLVIALLIISLVSGIYILFQKYWSEQAFSQAINIINNEGNLEKASAKLSSAIKFNQQDRYYRAFSEFNLIKMQEIVSQKNLSPEVAQEQFQAIFNSAAGNAQSAINLNSQDSLNWMQLAKVYATIIPLGVKGAGDMAIGYYQEALKTSPSDTNIMYMIGVIYSNNGEKEKAIEMFEKIDELEPGNIEIQKILNKLQTVPAPVVEEPKVDAKKNKK